MISFNCGYVHALKLYYGLIPFVLLFDWISFVLQMSRLRTVFGILVWMAFSMAMLFVYRLTPVQLISITINRSLLGMIQSGQTTHHILDCRRRMISTSCNFICNNLIHNLFHSAIALSSSLGAITFPLCLIFLLLLLLVLTHWIHPCLYLVY